MIIGAFYYKISNYYLQVFLKPQKFQFYDLRLIT